MRVGEMEIWERSNTSMTTPNFWAAKAQFMQFTNSCVGMGDAVHRRILVTGIGDACFDAMHKVIKRDFVSIEEEEDELNAYISFTESTRWGSGEQAAMSVVWLSE